MLIEAEAGGEVEETVGVVEKTWWHYGCVTERQSQLENLAWFVEVHEGLRQIRETWYCIAFWR